jgi:exodeoxyribonuclease VII small subunit
VAKKNNDDFNFEKALAELEQLVEKMEQGGLSLEESLRCFERGIALTKACQKALRDAEQRVQILLEQGNRETLQTFAPDVQADDETGD